MQKKIVNASFLCILVLIFFELWLLHRTSNAVDAPSKSKTLLASSFLQAATPKYLYKSSPYYSHSNLQQVHTVAVIIRIGIQGDPQCHVLQKTLDSVYASSWKAIQVFIFERSAEYQECIQSWQNLVGHKNSTMYMAHYEGNMEHMTNKAVHAAYLILMEPGDTIVPTYFESAIWTMMSSQSKIGFVSTFYDIVNNEDEVIFRAEHSTDEAITTFYGTSPGAIFSVHAINEAQAFATKFDEQGCEDWEAKWRILFSKWKHYIIRERYFVKHARNVHHQKISHVQCITADGAAKFLKYLKSEYPSVPLITPFPPRDGTNQLKRQTLSQALAFDSLAVASRPNSAPVSKRGVLLLIPWLVVGGAEAVSVNVIQQLAKRGWHITVVMFTDGSYFGGNAWEPTVRKTTHDIFYIPRFLDRTYYHNFVCHLIRSRGIDAIFNNNCLIGYAVLPYIRLYCPVGAVIDINHNWFPSYFDGGYASFSIDYQSYLDYQLQISNMLAKKMIAEGADSKKISTAYIGTNTTFYAAEPMNNGQCVDFLKHQLKVSVSESTSRKPFVVLYMGRMSAEKQPDVFVDAMVQLAGSSLPREFVAIMAGGGPIEKYISDKIAQSPSSMTTMVGVLNNEQKRTLLSCVDTLVMTSESEGTPLVIFEALSMGVPVIAPKVGGVPEIVSAKVGTLVSNNCTKSEQASRYAQVLLQYMHKSDEDFQKMKKHARNRAVSKFDLEIFGEKIHQLMLQAIASKQAEGWRRVDSIDVWPIAPQASADFVRLILANLRIMLEDKWHS